jgi:hypothetical protein
MRWRNVGRAYLKFFSEVASANRALVTRSPRELSPPRLMDFRSDTVLHGGVQ